MKSRVSLMVAAGFSLLASPALAAPVFLLQFGSFETREEAESRLGELNAKHSGVLGRMQSGIREVTLPPDNLTVYRTQAGPLETRADAQSVCSQLASNGDECYVVETAMMQPLSAPTTQLAQAAQAVQAAPAAVAAATTAALAPITAAPVAGISSVSPQAAPPVVMSPVPARDPGNMATLARASGAAPASAPQQSFTSQMTGAPDPLASATPALQAPASPVVVAAAAPSAGLQAAMDKAVAEQNTALATAPTPTGAKKEGTFWSRLNPFSDDEEIAPKAVAVPKVEAPISAPVEPVITAAVAAGDLPAALPIPAPVLAPVRVEPAAVATPAPLVIDTPAPAPSMQLPPPPAPLNLADRAAFDAGQLPMAGTVPTVPAPLPVLTPESTGTLAAAPALADGNVRVGEAQRVPLSEATLPPPPASFGAVPAATPVPMALPAVSLKPSSTLGQKTLWAQIGTFDDTQGALAYWEQYRRTHPDFPVVRVRVTSPYQAITRGLNHVSLRVGPFAKTESINNLCRTVTEAENTAKLRCGQIIDMGVAAGIGGRRAGYLPGSRYQR